MHLFEKQAVFLLSPSDLFVHITSSQTMRFSLVFAVAAALTTSISARPRNAAESEECPAFCNFQRCCAGQKCIPQYLFTIWECVDR
ncbi:uncharacterized protein EDB91DRAFT_1333172 [Suillus paluster]|uniref:uncharacterized protein n=1 Tax=Suillus paluster TaxID=48578 RepID=UPI001B86DAE1|nr:uncharacterized protein EDB91DRAFT_1333172 [Suillus paluster]KAG1753804.1 hypothetical protein EDB91DRAFT_1333172 [Suillus paluster]